MNLINLGLMLATWKARAAVAGAIVLALVSWRAFDIHKQRAIGAERVVAKIERAADAKVSKATSARNRVERIPDERLRDGYFRD